MLIVCHPNWNWCFYMLELFCLHSVNLVPLYQGRWSVVKIGGQTPFFDPPLLLRLPSLPPSPPLISRPRKCSQGECCKLHQQRGAVSSPDGLWGRAPAEIEFCTFLPPKIWRLVVTILVILLIINWPKLWQFKHKGISWFLCQIDMEVHVAA